MQLPPKLDGMSEESYRKALIQHWHNIIINCVKIINEFIAHDLTSQRNFGIFKYFPIEVPKLWKPTHQVQAEMLRTAILRIKEENWQWKQDIHEFKAQLNNCLALLVESLKPYLLLLSKDPKASGYIGGERLGKALEPIYMKIISPVVEEMKHTARQLPL